MRLFSWAFSAQLNQKQCYEFHLISLLIRKIKYKLLKILNTMIFHKEYPEMLEILTKWATHNKTSFSGVETAVITSSMQDYADLEVKKSIAETLDINDECKKELAFSNDLKVNDKCSDCEFCLSHSVGIIGGMTGTCADFFCGSGSFGEKAKILKRNVILNDINPAAIKLSQKRLNDANDLFNCC